MNEFLQTVKFDLLSRRLLPFVALLVVLLIVAVAYAVAGGSQSPVAPPAAGTSGAHATTGVIAVAVAPANPTAAVSETPGGARYQSQGPTRDPFIPLPSPPTGKQATGKTSGSSNASGATGSASTGSSGSSGGSGGTSTHSSPAPAPAKPVKPAKPKFPYTVSVLFGLLPGSGETVKLTPYENLKPQQALPSKKEARVSFERVTSDGKGAVFKLVVAPILHGSGICLPSASECQTLDLETGHSEELEYVEANGSAVVYELKTVSIVKSSATAARAKASAKVARVKTRKP